MVGGSGGGGGVDVGGSSFNFIFPLLDKTKEVSELLLDLQVAEHRGTCKVNAVAIKRKLNLPYFLGSRISLESGRQSVFARALFIFYYVARKELNEFFWVCEYGWPHKAQLLYR